VIVVDIRSMIYQLHVFTHDALSKDARQKGDNDDAVTSFQSVPLYASQYEIAGQSEEYHSNPAIIVDPKTWVRKKKCIEQLSAQIPFGPHQESKDWVKTDRQVPTTEVLNTHSWRD
jgi:hypothetical protein